MVPKKSYPKLLFGFSGGGLFPRCPNPSPGPQPPKGEAFVNANHINARRDGTRHIALIYVRSATPNRDNCSLRSPILVTRKAPHNTRWCGDVSAKSSPTQLKQLCSSPHTHHLTSILNIGMAIH